VLRKLAMREMLRARRARERAIDDRVRVPPLHLTRWQKETETAPL